MLHGKAPVAIGDIVHALTESPAGMRPLPIKEGESAMRAVPVLVGITCLGTMITLHPRAWQMIPHVAPNRDAEKGPITEEQKACVIFHVSIPPGWKLVNEEEERRKAEAALAPENDPQTGVEDGPKEIPELAGVDPDVFRTNPDRLNENLREMNKKPIPGQGASADAN